MSKIRKIVIAGALAVASIIPLAAAEAMPVTNAPANAEKSTGVQQARWCGRWRCGYRRGYNRGRYWGPRVRYGYRPYWGPRVVIRPAPRVVVRTGYSRHVRWCLNNYQSYDVDSNTFVTYDGDVRRCRSPFR
ncbi:BA14K family protein [Rhizobium sp. TH2]|uniref:BA14K family protein n=1 Tax=Rhizobium sp. TH2 TaxID=2775403 RepID=UPI0021589173|nr:BA14K family protein [Rhizobium sp. TH2]UVC09611.1 BA14K family protein [Rhizobium sp. TH2]